MGAIEQNIIAQAKRCNDPIPDRIKNKPRLSFGLTFYLRAFSELDSERDFGMGMGPIPWSSMHQYAMILELTGEAYEDFMYLIRELDREYITHITKKRPTNGESS